MGSLSSTLRPDGALRDPHRQEHVVRGDVNSVLSTQPSKTKHATRPPPVPPATICLSIQRAHHWLCRRRFWVRQPGAPGSTSRVCPVAVLTVLAAF